MTGRASFLHLRLGQLGQVHYEAICGLWVFAEAFDGAQPSNRKIASRAEFLGNFSKLT